jgi:O-antigen/teichoic acid export membrane protein
VAITTTRYLVAGVLGIGWAALLARALGPSGAGAVTLAILVPTLGASATNLGLPSATAYLLARKRYASEELAAMNLILSVVLGLLGLVAGMLFLPLVMTLAGAQTTALLNLGLFGLPALILLALLGGVLHGAQEFGRHAVSTVAPIVLALSASLALLAMGRLTGERLMLCWVGAQYATAAWLVFLLGRRARWPGRNRFRSYLSESLSYGWRIHIDALASLLGLRVDNFILGHLAGLGAVGIYSGAVWIVERMWIVSHAAGQVLLPVVASMDEADEQRREVTPIIARWNLVFTAAAAGALLALAYPLVLLLFGEAFRPSVLPLIVLLPGAVAMSHSRVLAGDLMARGRVDVTMRIALQALGLNIVANLLLIPWLGAVGAALASTLSYSANLLLRLQAYCRLSGVRWQSVVWPQPADRELARRAWQRLQAPRGARV